MAHAPLAQPPPVQPLLCQVLSRRWPLLLLVAAGSVGCEKEVVLPTLLTTTDATPVAVWVGQGQGASPAGVPVYATNAQGAAVPVASIGVTSDGTVDAAVIPGADGWGVASVGGVAPARLGVTATLAPAVADATAGGIAWLVDDSPGSLGFPAIAAGTEATILVSAAGGVAWASGGEVWWADWSGAPPARVLALSAAIEGMWTVNLDTDGVPDLVAWSADEVVVLRGRDDGGLVWGAGWAVEAGVSVTGVAPGSVDTDATPDLAIALSDDDGSWVALLSGDGAWGFTIADVLGEIAYRVGGVSVEDLDGNGVPEVTVITAEGLLRRYTLLDGAWANTLSGTEYDLEIGEGSKLWPSTDLTGDGIPELFAAGPSTTATGWQAWVVTAGSDVPKQHQIFSALPTSLGVALADVSGDGVADFVLSADDKVIRGQWAEGTGGGGFKMEANAAMPRSAAVAVDDVDGDGVRDIVLGGETLRALRGEQLADDPVDDPDMGTTWAVETPEAVVFGLHLVAPPVVADVNADGVVDVVALVRNTLDGGVGLQGFAGALPSESAAETLRSGGLVTLTATGSAVALAVCDLRAYALYSEGGVTWLAQANLGSGLGPSVVSASVAVTGTHLACGTFAAGDVVVADDAGATSFIDSAGLVTPGAAVGTLGTMLAADTDGDGLDELLTCAEPGCTLAAGDLDADGLTDLVVQDSSGVRITTATTVAAFTTGGAMRIADADGDGVDDLVFGEAGATQVIRAVGGEFAPPLASWVWRPVSDPVAYGDLSGDGVPDAFLLGADLDPASTSFDDWVGTLVYVQTN